MKYISWREDNQDKFYCCNMMIIDVFFLAVQKTIRFYPIKIFLTSSLRIFPMVFIGMVSTNLISFGDFQL